jgi:hypothetical protein
MLTLVAVPVIYTWFDDRARNWKARWDRWFPPVDRGAEEVGVLDIHKVSESNAKRD